MDPEPASALHAPATAGALAASLLGRACLTSPETRDSPHLGVVEEAALDLGRQLDSLAETDEDGPLAAQLLVEGALLCADLATLAACAVPELPERRSPDARAATHLASGAVRALYALVDPGQGKSSCEEYVARDVKSAAWRAGLAERQVSGSAD